MRRRECGFCGRRGSGRRHWRIRSVGLEMVRLLWRLLRSRCPSRPSRRRVRHGRDIGGANLKIGGGAGGF